MPKNFQKLGSQKLRIVNVNRIGDVTIVTQKFEFAEKIKLESRKMKLNGPNGNMERLERTNGGKLSRQG